MEGVEWRGAYTQSRDGVYEVDVRFDGRRLRTQILAMDVGNDMRQLWRAVGVLTQHVQEERRKAAAKEKQRTYSELH